MAKTMEKRKIMIVSKIIEIPVMLLGVTAFMLHNIYLVMISIFLLGLISTLFSPSKYGLIRDIGGNEGISFGTGTLEMLTFFGVLLGTLIASIVSDHFSLYIMTGVIILVGISGLFSTTQIRADESEPMKHNNETINPLKFLLNSFRWSATMKGMNFIILGLGSFWMIGNLIQMNLMTHCTKVLCMTNTQTGMTMVCAAIGIGLGSFITGLISNGKVELGFSPVGAAGMIVNLGLVYFIHPSGAFFIILIFLTAFFCGMFMVPLSAYVQKKIEGRRQGDMIAYSNFVSFLLIFITSGLYMVLTKYFDTNAVFLSLFVMITVLIAAMLRYIPEMQERVKFILRIK